MFSRLMVSVNNYLVRRIRRPRYPAAGVLLLAPRCLHNSGCKLDVEEDINECRLCGKCNVRELVGIAREYGIRCRISRGGREAAGHVKPGDVKGVVAVACHKELALGILAVFPKPVIAIPNSLPNGACRDTCVDAAEVRRAVAEMVAGAP